MFTGIVKGLGTVVDSVDREQFRVIVIDVHELIVGSVIGASVSVDGVCLTVTAIEGSRLTFDVMAETLVKTTMGHLKIGDRVGLDSPMKAGDDIGGHIVLGHVDGVGEVVAIKREGENCCMTFRAPLAVTPYIVDKGSIAIEGASLTVCYPQDGVFDVWLLPLTLMRTSLGHKKVGDQVNMEADYVLKAMLNKR